MNELAIKAMNETLDESDRSYINAEVQQLKIETNRIAYATDFNGIQMLISDSLVYGGGGGALEEGVAVGDPQIVPPFYLNGAAYSYPAIFEMKIAGGDERAVAYFDYNMVPPSYSVNTTPGEDINVIYGFFAIQMKSGYEPIDLVFTAPGGQEFRVSSSRFLSPPFPDPNQNTQETQFVSGLGDVQFHWSTDYYGNYEMSIYFKPGQRNGANDNDRTTAFDGRWFVSVDNGKNAAAVDFDFMFICQNNTGQGYLDAGLIEYETYTSGGGGAGGSGLRRLDDIRLLVGTSVTDGNIISVSRKDMRSQSLGLAGVDMRTTAGAYAAIDPIKRALSYVANARSYFGSVQNRLEHTINNLKNVVENTAAAESAIRDTDMATEMVAFANNNVLMSAVEAMLAQANQNAEMVLGLLEQ
jgi:flagellin